MVNYAHRNYLGGIIKLGFTREKVGDIIVSHEGADIIVVADFAEILTSQLPSLTRFANSKITIEAIENLHKREVRMEEVKIIVPSLRLDNIVSDLARTSRNIRRRRLSIKREFL